MKLSIPHIKIGSAGVGFILCLIVIVGIGFLLNSAGEQTIKARQDKIPMAEVILNPGAYATETAEVSDIIPEEAAIIEAVQEIEKDRPPVVEEIAETIEVKAVETLEPIEQEISELFEPITIAEDEPQEIIEEVVEIVEVVEEPIQSIEAEEVIAAINKNQPRIALILSDMGLSSSATDNAISALPSGVTLAFAPYANNIDTWVKRAIRNGHDVLISIPMEPKTFPRDDPGPNALLTSVSDAENIKRLDWALSQTSGYVGIVNFMGSRFTASQEKLSPVIQHLKDKNIMILDSGSGGDSLIPSMSRVNNISYARNDRFIDNKATATAIDEQLQALENIAVRRGQAIGIGFPYPVTLDRLDIWIKTLESKGIILTPISDLNPDKAQ